MSKTNTKTENPKNNDYYITELLRVSYNEIADIIDYTYKELNGIIISITNSPNPNYKDIIIRYKKNNEKPTNAKLLDNGF